jgi:hypothetical protein
MRVTVPRAFMDYWSSSDNLETALMSEIYMHTGVYSDLKLDELLRSKVLGSKKIIRQWTMFSSPL